MTQFIVDLLGKLPQSVLKDLGLYIALGLTLLVFLVGVIVSAATSGELGRFRTCVSNIAKDASPKNVNANMQLMPVKVKKLYKRAMMTNAKPSDVINVDAAVNTPYNKSAVKKLPAVTAMGSAAAICIGVGVCVVYGGGFLALGGAAVLAGALLGGLLTLIASGIASSSYKNAVKSYDTLMDILDEARKNGASAASQTTEREDAEQESQEEEERIIHSKSDFEGPSRITVEIDEGDSEPQAEPVYAAPSFEPQAEPVYTAQTFEPQEQSYVEPEYPRSQPQAEPQAEEPAPAAIIVEQAPMSDAEIRAKAREEALAAARAEQAERMKAAQAQQAQARNAQGAAAAPNRASAQQRLEELKAQREAQLKAQREAQAQQAAQAKASAAAAKPSVSTEDVIARIEQINRDGATLPVMKEVALLLQQERAKPENKTPEQQKKLNEALSKLLKAMSAANKK